MVMGKVNLPVWGGVAGLPCLGRGVSRVTMPRVGEGLVHPVSGEG